MLQLFNTCGSLVFSLMFYRLFHGLLVVVGLLVHVRNHESVPTVDIRENETNVFEPD